MARCVGARHKVRTSMLLPTDCVQMHTTRMMLLLYLLELKGRHAVLQTLSSLTKNTRALNMPLPSSRASTWRTSCGNSTKDPDYYLR